MQVLWPAESEATTVSFVIANGFRFSMAGARNFNRGVRGNGGQVTSYHLTKTPAKAEDLSLVARLGDVRL